MSIRCLQLGHKPLAFAAVGVTLKGSCLMVALRFDLPVYPNLNRADAHQPCGVGLFAEGIVPKLTPFGDGGFNHLDARSAGVPQAAPPNGGVFNPNPASTDDGEGNRLRSRAL
jgi:hypothetical protein